VQGLGVSAMISESTRKPAAGHHLVTGSTERTSKRSRSA
jgi:hypothetical protein